MKQKTPLQSLTEKLSAAGINRYQISLIRELIRYEINAEKKADQLSFRKSHEELKKSIKKHGAGNILKNPKLLNS